MNQSKYKWWVAAAGILILAVVIFWVWRDFTPGPGPGQEVNGQATSQLETSEPLISQPTTSQQPTLVTSQMGPQRVRFQSGDQYLIVEFLDDDLVHFELSAFETEGEPDHEIFTTPMVDKTDYVGPQSFNDDGQGNLETDEVRVEVDTESLCIDVTDKSKEPDLLLTQVCPWELQKDFKGITFTAESFTHAYGLGEKFIDVGIPDGDWVGRERYPGEFGNVQAPFNNGNVGNDQFPILYLAGQGLDSYALFVDNQYKQYWNLLQNPWKVAMGGKWVRFFILTGPDLQDLRKDFMELVGKPPVPPKKAFGLWISEYGYDNWPELEDKLATLRENSFPVDGFVLDLQWYGGIQEGSDNTQTGSLTWDEENFPDPEEKIAYLRDEEGVGIMVIEQPYVGRNLPEHAELSEKGYLVRTCPDCEPVYLVQNPWWGKGGMLDWTNPQLGPFWHDWKRVPLIEAGVIGHWTDLGEPELYDPNGWYHGIEGDYEALHEHADIHNLYNLLWSKSIYEGYQQSGEVQRPFILSRSGTAGSQRYGVAMWSGDISSRLSSLASHLNVQMHMSMSGVDYYGSDIGGFFRQGEDPLQMYTQWFANGMAFDVPGRAHVFNLCNCEETAPDRIGDVESNLFNVRQRYELLPYFYSLAHRAYLYGEPVIPPLVYYYQTDEEVREIGGEKMIGGDVLVAATAELEAVERQVYLPEGTWVDYHSGEWIQSQGEWIEPVFLYPDGRFNLPMYVLAGAIIPQMYVDDQTMNVEGKRLDGSQRDELIVRVYADPTPNQFTLYEDDGKTIAYQQGQVRTTLLSQQLSGDQMRVTIQAAQGSYANAPLERSNLIKLFTDGLTAKKVTLNGLELDQYFSLKEFEPAISGWMDNENGQVIVKTNPLPIAEDKIFEFDMVPVEETQAQVESTQQLDISWPTDNWQKAVPEAQGMESQQLLKGLEFIKKKYLDIQDLLVLRNGYSVLEVPFYTDFDEMPYENDALAPSFLSALIGIAIDQGYIEDVNQKVLDFFPDSSFLNMEPAKQSMTVENLLTMTSGLDCEEFQFEDSQNWVQAILDLPIIEPPGESFNVCPAVPHLLSAILQQSTGMSALQFAEQYLFTPLGITEITWSIDPQGINTGWKGLRIKPSDTAKLGYLYLNEGVWQDQQIVSAEWVKASITPQVEGISYGYQWWIDPAGFFNWDFPGQWLIVIPKANLVTVLKGSISDPQTWNIRILMQAFILEAVRSQSPLAENLPGTSALQAEIAELSAIPEVREVPPLPEIGADISGKTYILDENPTGWKNINLTFNGGAEAIFEINTGLEALQIPVGLDNVPRVLTIGDEQDPESVRLATKGLWEGENDFVIDLAQKNAYFLQRFQFILTFIGERVTLRLEPTAPPQGTLEIEGQMQN